MEDFKRFDGRGAAELRPVELIPDFTKTKGGSVLINWGETRVLCTALLEEGAMPFLKNTGMGWLTAEYAMLPSSTGDRKSGTASKKTAAPRRYSGSSAGVSGRRWTGRLWGRT